jgi:hypothetical protein
LHLAAAKRSHPPVADIDVPAAFLRAAAPARRRDQGRLDSRHLNPASQAIDPSTVAVTHLLPSALRSRDTVIIEVFAGSVSGPACSDTVSIYRALLDCPLLSRRSHLYPRGHDIDAAFWPLLQVPKGFHLAALLTGDGELRRHLRPALRLRQAGEPPPRGA